MIEALVRVNFLAVLAATVVHTLLGGAWFVGLFAKPYAAALGIEDRPPQKPSPRFIVGPLICSAVTIVTTGLLLQALAITTLSAALGVGAIVGLGYLAPMTVNIAINPLFPKPFRYALVNVPFFLLGSLASSAILVALS
jgi:hypothetical protein